MLEVFASTYSEALQKTLYLMGKAVLEARPEVAEVKFSAPNKHHFLVDLAPFGVENNGEVFIAADRPYGLIEATVQREDGSDPGDAWLTVPGFC
jgi:urate oxidase